MFRRHKQTYPKRESDAGEVGTHDISKFSKNSDWLPPKKKKNVQVRFGSYFKIAYLVQTEKENSVTTNVKYGYC